MNHCTEQVCGARTAYWYQILVFSRLGLLKCVRIHTRTTIFNSFDTFGHTKIYMYIILC